ncbi:MAG: hypothetical protein IJ770_03350 [Alphaproteobacteria bacterium]|nr:hypothetical protein [Alphaproteobacteria bacterium]
MAYTSPTLTLMVGAVKKAASALGRDFNELEHLQNSIHGDKGFAQHSYDKVQKILFEELGKVKSGLPIVTTGKAAMPANGAYFAICPIDGFANFAHGNADFAVSAALIDGSAVVDAVVYSPISDEIFFAEKGYGSFKEGFRNHERLRVANAKNAENAVVAVGKDLRILKNTAEMTPNLRISGVPSLDLAYLAAGKLDAVVAQADFCTLCAGVLLVKESGGYVFAVGETDTRSENIIPALQSGHLFAANEALKQKIADMAAK